MENGQNLPAENSNKPGKLESALKGVVIVLGAAVLAIGGFNVGQRNQERKYKQQEIRNEQIDRRVLQTIYMLGNETISMSDLSIKLARTLVREYEKKGPGYEELAKEYAHIAELCGKEVDITQKYTRLLSQVFEPNEPNQASQK